MSESLLGLLTDASLADPANRIELFRDRIVDVGEPALRPMSDWLREPRLAAFAVRVLERLGTDPSLRPRVIAALTAPGLVAFERDILWTLDKLGYRRPRTPSPKRQGGDRRSVHVVALRSMRARDVFDAVMGFDSTYARDWDAWLQRRGDVTLFGQILRRWRAARPSSPRWPRREARHEPPFLEDLVEAASPMLMVIRDLRLVDIRSRTGAAERAFEQLWDLFSNLAIERPASEVGISKAVLLLTYGRIGPALDSEVRNAIGISRVRSHGEWLAILDEVADDIAAFEASEGSLKNAVPAHFSGLEYGRLYDMVMGPGERML